MADYVYWVTGQAHAECAELSIASVKSVDSLAYVTVYSDYETDSKFTGADNVVRWDIKRPAMVANLDAQLHYLMTVENGANVLFLDADVLLRQRFPFSLEKPDLYVTYRDHVGIDADGKPVQGIAAQMPYNYGVLGATAGIGSRLAFSWLRDRILGMNPDLQAWYGNQLALVDLIGHPEFLSENAERTVRRNLFDSGARFDRIRVRTMPCEVYNYTPEGPGEDVSGKVALHFKGGRKDMMQAYASP